MLAEGGADGLDAKLDVSRMVDSGSHGSVDGDHIMVADEHPLANLIADIFARRLAAWSAGAERAETEHERAADRDRTPAPVAEGHGVDGRVERLRESLPAGAIAALICEPRCDAWAEFRRGYLAAGVAGQWLDHFLSVVIPCESRWNTLAVSPGGHLGLVQFAPASWSTVARITGYQDWRRAFDQGFNAARWASMTTPSNQWACW